MPMTKRVQHRYEFSFKAKDELIFTYVSSAPNLATWFADKVELKDGIFTFFWKDNSERAKIVKSVPRKSITFKWIDRIENESLIFSIETDEVTRANILVITEFDDEDQFQAGYLWWTNTLLKLRNKLGG